MSSIKWAGTEDLTEAVAFRQRHGSSDKVNHVGVSGRACRETKAPWGGNVPGESGSGRGHQQGWRQVCPGECSEWNQREEQMVWRFGGHFKDFIPLPSIITYYLSVKFYPNLPSWIRSPVSLPPYGTLLSLITSRHLTAALPTPQLDRAQVFSSVSQWCVRH